MTVPHEFVALTLICATAVACTGGDSVRTIDPLDVVEPDFAAELVVADTSRWEQAQADPAAEPIARTSGGRASQLLVGPGTLTLADGTLIDVAPGTRGGTLCPQLDLFRQPNEPPAGIDDRQACLVVGMFEPGTTTAAWFATEIVDRVGEHYGSNGEVAFLDGRAVLAAGFDSLIALRVSGSADVGCGMDLADVFDEPDAGYDITFTAELEVIAVECHGRM